jgi:hypothetical protein
MCHPEAGGVFLLLRRFENNTPIKLEALMKKGLLLSVMALALTATAADVKFDGQVRYRMENSNYAFDSDVDSYNHSLLRTRLGATVTPQDGLTIVIQAQDSRHIGDAALATSAQLNKDDNMGLHQAYFAWNCQLVNNLTILAGRFEYAKADERFFGKSDWNNNGMAHEGWALLYKTPVADIDVFGVKHTEAEAYKQDVTNFGVYFGNILGKRVDLLYNVLDFGQTPVTEDKNSFSTIAVHYDNVYNEKIGVNFNFGTQMGTDENTDTDYTGMMYGLDLNYTLGLGILDRVGFGYESLSANDPDTGDFGWLELFPTDHKFHGYQGIAGQTGAGLNDIQLNFWGGLPMDINYKLDYHMFSFIEDTGFEPNTDLGSEIDLSLVKKVDNFAVNLGYSMFMPTDNIAPAGDAQSWMYLQFTAGF